MTLEGKPVTPGTRSSAFLTTIGQVPQVIFSTANVVVCGGAPRAVLAAIRTDRDTEPRLKRRMTILPQLISGGHTTGMR